MSKTKRRKSLEAIGVDVGGVIIDRVNDNTDTSFFSDNYLSTTAVPHVFDILERLVKERFGKHVFIVSKCGIRTEAKTIHWFTHHRFFERTGILPEHVRFCRTREGKAPICTELGITHFVDDRLEVLGHLKTVPNQFLFRGNPREVNRFANHLGNVYPVTNWQEIAQILL